MSKLGKQPIHVTLLAMSAPHAESSQGLQIGSGALLLHLITIFQGTFCHLGSIIQCLFEPVLDKFCESKASGKGKIRSYCRTNFCEMGNGLSGSYHSTTQQTVIWRRNGVDWWMRNFPCERTIRYAILQQYSFLDTWKLSLDVRILPGISVLYLLYP